MSKTYRKRIGNRYISFSTRIWDTLVEWIMPIIVGVLLYCQLVMLIVLSHGR